MNVLEYLRGEISWSKEPSANFDVGCWVRSGDYFGILVDYTTVGYHIFWLNQRDTRWVDSSVITEYGSQAVVGDPTFVTRFLFFLEMGEDYEIC